MFCWLFCLYSFHNRKLVILVKFFNLYFFIVENNYFSLDFVRLINLKMDFVFVDIFCFVIGFHCDNCIFVLQKEVHLRLQFRKDPLLLETSVC